MQRSCKVRLKLLALVASGFLLSSGSNIQAQTPPPAPVSLSITASHHAIPPSAACDIAIKVTNISTKPIALRINNDAMDAGKDWGFQVVDKSSGAPLKLKESYANPPFSVYTQHSSLRFKRLQPGESFTRTIDISRLFDLPPGTYQVQVIRHLPKEYGGATALSNKVNITIAP